VSAAVAPRDTEQCTQTLALALRLLVLALTAHTEDIATLNDYGNMPEHLTDVIADFVDDGDEDSDSF
jgi:hypothetical protein